MSRNSEQSSGLFGATRPVDFFSEPQCHKGSGLASGRPGNEKENLVDYADLLTFEELSYGLTVVVKKISELE
ncbi:MAG: hypothetical protein LBQ00_08275 [Syntrophobacterales bacterium]|jgi:hypothetical protein|nr:hypothetical protein [Syntrophobacterales bacterium]